MESWQKHHIQENLVELIKQTSCNAFLTASLAEANVLHSCDVEEIERVTLTPSEKSKRLYEILQTRQGSYEILLKSLRDTNQTGALKTLSDQESVYQKLKTIAYDKNHVLGKGSHGTKVFKGSYNDMDVAVKVLTTDILEENIGLKEIELLKQLQQHENIVGYYGSEINNGLIYIAFELCKISLQDEISQKLVNMDSKAILYQTTNGLQYLHSQNIVHRDLKPANILLSFNNQVKISDFGLSKKIPLGKTSLTLHSGVQGTADWIPPETLRGFSESGEIFPKTTKAGDIFSLGCIFYFTLTSGEHPFGEFYERHHNIFSNKPKVNATIGNHWKALIISMINENPLQRPSATSILNGSWFKTKNGLVRQLPSNHTLSEIDTDYNQSLQACSSNPLIGTDYLELKDIFLLRNQFPLIQNTNYTHNQEEGLIPKLFGKLKYTRKSSIIYHANQVLNTIWPSNPSAQIQVEKLILNFFEDLQNTQGILVIKTFDMDYSVSKLQGLIRFRNQVAVGREGVTNVYDLGDPVSLEHLKCSKSFQIATSMVFDASNLRLIQKSCKKFVVVTLECLANDSNLIVVNDWLTWSELPESFREDSVQILKNSKTEDPELLKVISETMLRQPSKYNELSNEALKQLISGNSTNRTLALLVNCYLDIILSYCAKTEDGKLKAVFGLASLVNPSFNFARATFDSDSFLKNLQNSILLFPLVVSTQNGNEHDRVATKAQYKCFEWCIIARVISQIQDVANSEALIEDYFGVRVNFSEITDATPGAFILQYLDLLTLNCISIFRKVVERNVSFLKYCLQMGYFNLLNQLLKESPALLNNLAEPIVIRYNFKTYTTVEEFMKIYSSSSNIELISTAKELPSWISDTVCPLNFAILQNNLGIFELLIKKYHYKHNLSQDKLSLCCYNTVDLGENLVKTRIKMLQIIFAVNPQVAKASGKFDSVQCQVPLVFAGIHFEVLKFLAKQGLVLRNLDNFGSTIIHQAATYMPNDQLLQLIQFIESTDKAMLSENNLFDEPPVFAACDSFKIKRDTLVIEALLKAIGADNLCAGFQGRTLLHSAAVAGNLDVCGYLIKQGISVHVKDDLGQTPLHHVARYSEYLDPVTVRYLLFKGVDLDARNKEDKTALDLFLGRAHQSNMTHHQINGIVNLLSCTENVDKETEC